MAQIRVMHYLNQFFAGVGGEEKADVPLGFYEGPVGPGNRLQALCGDKAKIVATAYCGDNYFSAHREEVLEKILQLAKDQNADTVVAGPAFGAGRYGFACSEICHYVSVGSGLYGVTCMHIENPGVDGYKQYKDKKVFLFPTSEAVSGMEDALSKMARFISKLVSGFPIGPASDEGYVPRGVRVDEGEKKSGVERAIDMLFDKIAGRPFTTEIPVEIFKGVPVAHPITSLKNAQLALVSTSGVVPLGNPDKFRGFRNTQWKKYPIAKLNSMKDAKWDVVHSGYNTMFMYANPNYGVPLDACRALERESVFAGLYPSYYETTGVQALISAMETIGREMALDMKAEGIDGALLVSTWGSCTRSGAVITKEIEREGIPVALITAMSMMGKQIGANRVVTGTKIPHPCGDPNLPAEADLNLRKKIVESAFRALQTDVNAPTIFKPEITYTYG